VNLERMIVGSIAVLLILEAARRLIGLTLVIIAIVALLYGNFSEYLPGFLAGQPLTWGRLVNYLYLDPNSILGMLSLAATVGFGFVFFGQVLLKFGGGDALTNLALLFFGRTRGGSAKAAVVGSSLVGTVTGAPMSNVYLTGTITIPLMIRSGYSPRMAGAVEAVASTGGQIMPPVMGIAAFIIAERLGVPYAEIALAALIPAILYYLTIFVQVDLEAGKNNLRGLQGDELPNFKETMKEIWPVLPVLAVLIYTIFIIRLSPAVAAAITGILAIPILSVRKKNREGFKERFIKVFEETGLVCLDVASALAIAGLVVGVISVSGLGFTLGSIMAEIGESSLVLLLVAAAVGSTILGMGMPSVAAYALVAVLVAPALAEYGINEIAAHLFIFYFSIISNFTPPIALAVFAAASIARSNPMSTGWTATRLGILAYIVPFLFVYSPSLILQGTWLEIILSLITAIIGTIILGTGLVGYLFAPLSPLYRVAAIISGIHVIDSH
jgi:TRAP transporter 4TM/12TM fusion protein